jgi:hypothetical protein
MEMNALDLTQLKRIRSEALGMAGIAESILRAIDSDDYLTVLDQARILNSAQTGIQDAAVVLSVRHNGASWSEIGRLLYISKQAAWEAYSEDLKKITAADHSNLARRLSVDNLIASWRLEHMPLTDDELAIVESYVGGAITVEELRVRLKAIG